MNAGVGAAGAAAAGAAAAGVGVVVLLSSFIPNKSNSTAGCCVRLLLLFGLVV